MKVGFFEHHLRRESFGGTLFQIKTGRRTYIDNAEFCKIATFGYLDEDMSRCVGFPVGTVHVIEPPNLFDYNFSAPDKVFVELTHGCNLRCTHCLNSSGSALGDKLQTKGVQNLLKSCGDFGVQEVRFTGGEPLVVKQIANYVETANMAGLRTSIGTNGTLVTEEMSCRLASAGLNAAIVSVDGLESRHNAVRGNGMFKKTLQGLEHLRAKGIDVRVNVVVMRENLSDIVPLVSMLTSMGLHVLLRRLIPSGRAFNSVDEMLTADEYQQLEESLRVFLDTKQPFIEGHYLREKEVIPHTKLPFVRRNCSAGSRGLVVLSTGHIQTCGFLGSLGEKPIGHISEQSLSDVWHDLVTSDYISRLEARLKIHNTTTLGPQTNCLAIAYTNIRTPIRESP